MIQSKALSLLIFRGKYILAGVLGYFTYIYIPLEFYVKLLFADIVGTVVVFIFSLILKNASFYDAYWSVLPMVVVLFYMFTKEMNVVRLLASIAVLGWGLRLTINWIYTFDNLSWEDWRYRMLKEKTKAFYPIINFLGIHMFPTLVVYLCILPIAFIFNYDVSMNIGVVIFFILAVLSFSMQGLADLEMHKFRKNRNSVFIRNGLWKYSRHPNYLGEILMWWNIAALSIFALGKNYWLMCGALVNTLMFTYISIPMAENHQRERKEGFDEYKAETRMLLPIYKRTKKETKIED
jgi:steroid 5-alpha reductase family enzyme